MKLTFAFAALLLAWCSPGLATAQTSTQWLSGWAQNANGDYTRVDFIDASRITTAGNFRRGWIWSYYSPRDRDGPGYSHVITYMEVDCRERRARTLQATGYFTSGRSETIGREPTALSYVIPGSFGESNLIFICLDFQQRAASEDYYIVPADISLHEAAEYLFTME